MTDSVVWWLDVVGRTAFTLSAWAFVLLNGTLLAVLAWKRDRSLVNRWTARFLAVNVALLGTGIGVPLATLVTRAAVQALAPSLAVLSRGADAAPAEDGSPVDARAR